MLEREVLEVRPQRIGRDVGDEHRLAGRSGGAARADRRPDLDTVDRRIIGFGKLGAAPWRRCFAS